MGDYERAQAVEFVRALCHQLREMTSQLERIERQGVTGTNGRACAMRLEAAALRRLLAQHLRGRHPCEAPSRSGPPSGVARPGNRFLESWFARR